MHLAVFHPALHLSWFRSIDDDSYNCVKEVFEVLNIFWFFCAYKLFISSFRLFMNSP
jgi:hypothetical protein